MKRIMVVLLSSILICSLFSLPAFANEEKSTDNDVISVEDGLIGNPDDPNVYTPCPYGNGICQMYRRGNAYVYNVATGTVALANVPCWQCANCYTIITTSGDPGSGYSIGYYAIHSCNYQVGEVGTYFSIPNSSALYYTSASSLQGYKFMYNK